MKLRYLVWIFLVLIFGASSVLAWGFHKKPEQEDVPFRIINQSDSPVQILSARTGDEGTQFLKVKGIETAFIFKTQNTSERKIFSYQLLLTQYIAFEDYSTRKFIVNSTVALPAKGSQALVFSIPKNFREDSYYELIVKKVLFEDKEEWESKADSASAVSGRWEKIKQEIEGKELPSGTAGSTQAVPDSTQVPQNPQVVPDSQSPQN